MWYDGGVEKRPTSTVITTAEKIVLIIIEVRANMMIKWFVAMWFILTLAGCDSSRINIPAETIDEVRITDLMNKKVLGSTSHPELIKGLVASLNSASRDRGVYGKLEATQVELLRNKTVQHSFIVTSSRFDYQGKQYRDTSGDLSEIHSVICTGIRSKAISNKQHYTIGEEIQITWTLTNFGSKPIEIPAKLQGSFQWYRSEIVKGTKVHSWTGSNKMISSFTIDMEMPATIKTNGTCHLSIKIPAETVGGGKILISFNECPIARPNDVVINVRSKGERN